MFSHRFRREDQNIVRGYPPDRWGPWTQFPSYGTMIRNARFHALGWGWEVQTETGETVWSGKGVRIVKLEKAGKDLPSRVQGSRDPYMPGRILVPLSRVHPTLPKVTGAPPETFYRYNEKRRRVECMVSVMPDGLHVAWDTCGQCVHSIRTCRCAAVRPGRGVIHFYELATGEPFEKPTYESKAPVFERKKLMPFSPPLKLAKEVNGKTPLVKEAPKVQLTKDTSLSDFDDVAERTSDRKKAELVKSLNRMAQARPRLEKG